MLKNKNFAKSLLTLDIGLTDLSITVSAGEGTLFPATGSFRSVIWGAAFNSPLLDEDREIVEMTLTSGDIFAIIRAKEDTLAQNWNINDNIALVLTAGKIDELEECVQTRIASAEFTAADELMVGTGAGTHHQITLGASEFLAKGSSGALESKTAAEAREILNVENAADVTDVINIGTSVHGAANKATLINADKVPLIDTEDGNVLKTSTWTNIKAFLKTYFDTLYGIGVNGFGAPLELTIAVGEITVSGTNNWRFHSIDTEADAASDDLVTINGGNAGEMLILQAENDGRTVVCKNATSLKLKFDFSLNNIEDKLILVCLSSGVWHEISR